MKSTSTSNTTCIVCGSRKKVIPSFPGFLKLGIFLAIYYITNVGCTLAEENILKIPALGRISSLGSLYDSRTNTFADMNIFKSHPPAHLITTTHTPRRNTKYQIIKKDSDKFKLFDVDLDTAACIQAGIVQPEGAASVLSEDLTSSTGGVTGIFLQTFQTGAQMLSIFNDELRHFYTTESELYTEATHIVTGISWGGRIAATFSDSSSSVRNSKLLKQEFSKLKRTQENMSNKTSIFEIHLTSDIALKNPVPTTLSEVQGQLNQLQESIEKINSGLGLPLKLSLTPISIFKKYLNVTTTTKTNKVHKLDHAILREYLNFIDDIIPIEKTLLNIEENSNCISNQLQREMAELQKNFNAENQHLKNEFTKVLEQVKFGSLNNSALFQVLQNYESQEFNPKIVAATLTLNEPALKKVDFCSQLNENHPDIEYFGGASNFISRIYQHQHSNQTTYVLYTKSEFTKNDLRSYEDNLHIFLNILYKPSNVLFIVDCDFSYTQCESIHGSVIKQIRHGNYTFDDVRLNIKVTEIVEKKEVVWSCKQEIKVTGAVCVSPIDTNCEKLSSRKRPKQGKKKKPAESKKAKVVGGNNATPHEFPFQVLFLTNTTGVHCGGTILNENFILTAAHCLHDYDASDYKSWTVVAGDHNWKIEEGTEQRRQIQDVYIHNDFIPIAYVNDIAIVQLDRPLQLLSTEVEPIMLPDADYNATGVIAVVTGWGKLRYGGSKPLLLQKVTVPIVDRVDCVEAYEDRQVFVSIKMMCAGDVVDGGVDACHGDSGGPLSVKLRNGSSMLIGIVSNGINCGAAEYPGIYMQVSKYVDWINDTLTNFEKCSVRDRCENGGKCVDGNNTFSCICTEEFAGKFCEHVNKCRYPGTCASSSDDANCDSCRGGFVKDLEDETSCKYVNANSSIIISSGADISIISLNRLNTTQQLQNGLNDAMGTDYNFQTNKIFWFSYSHRKIYTAAEGKVDGKSILHDNPSSNIFGLAVDWIYNHLYWVDCEKHHLAVSNFNGTMKKVLFKEGLSLPYSIVVNPLNGWMYWSDRDKSRIERGGMDGSRREIIISTNIIHPRGLALDLLDSRLYWSQGGNPSSIWSSDFDGLNRKLIFTANPSQFSSSRFWKISLFDKYIYFIEYYSKSIYKVHKCNGEEFERIYKSESYLNNVKNYHETLQPEGKNFCVTGIQPCSHFCFPVPTHHPGNSDVTTTTCACPDELALYNERNCF